MCIYSTCLRIEVNANTASIIRVKGFSRMNYPKYLHKVLQYNIRHIVLYHIVCLYMYVYVHIKYYMLCHTYLCSRYYRFSTRKYDKLLI